MKRIFQAVLLAGLAMPAFGAADVKPAGENIILDPLKESWKVGYQQTKGPTTIIEFVKGNETVQAWTELTTLLSMGSEKNADLDASVLTIRSTVEQQCKKGAKVRVVGKTKWSRLPARLISVDCGLYPDGKPESYLALLIAGHDALYSFQRAKKAPQLDAATIKKWTPFLKKIHICDTRDPARPCEAEQTIDAR